MVEIVAGLVLLAGQFAFRLWAKKDQKKADRAKQLWNDYAPLAFDVAETVAQGRKWQQFLAEIEERLELAGQRGLSDKEKQSLAAFARQKAIAEKKKEKTP